MNYRRLGRRPAARKAIALGSLGTIAICILAILLPASVDRAARLASIGIIIGMHHLAKQLLDPLLAIHQEQGGRLGSRWVGVGIGSIFMVLILGAIAGALLLSGGFTGPNELPLRFETPSGQHDVVYSNDVPPAQAEALHNYLRKIGFFIDGHPSSFGLSREKGAYIMWVFIDKRAAADPETQVGMQSIARKVLEFLQQKRGTLRVITPDQERLGDQEVSLLNPLFIPDAVLNRHKSPATQSSPQLP